MPASGVRTLSPVFTVLAVLGSAPSVCPKIVAATLAACRIRVSDAMFGQALAGISIGFGMRRVLLMFV